MSILIKGMGMPTEEEKGKCIIVRHDGEVLIVEFDNLVDGGHVACYPTNPMRAVPVPPHGRLIDVDCADEYAYDELELAHGYLTGWEAARNMQKIYQNAPTIIEAEG